ncbi:MAG: general stress protein [Rhizobacter sp.]
MRQTVVGIFDRYAAAQHAAKILEDSGFDHDHVHVAAADDQSAGGTSAGTTAREDEGEGVMGRIRHFFAELFGPDDNEEMGTYAEAVRRGGAVVKVDVDEDAEVDKARETLQQAGAVNIDERVEEWRASGWSPMSDDTAGRSTQSTWTNAGSPAAVSSDEASTQDMSSRSAQADSRTGGVRVYSRAAETSGSEGQRAFDDDDSEFRKDFDAQYASSGARYDEYQPAYRYGSDMASDKRYSGRKWEDIEPDARRDWEQAHPDSAWDRFKAAIRHGWERVTS